MLTPRNRSFNLELLYITVIYASVCTSDTVENINNGDYEKHEIFILFICCEEL